MDLHFRRALFWTQYFSWESLGLIGRGPYSRNVERKFGQGFLRYKLKTNRFTFSPLMSNIQPYQLKKVLPLQCRNLKMNISLTMPPLLETSRMKHVKGGNVSQGSRGRGHMLESFRRLIDYIDAVSKLYTVKIKLMHRITSWVCILFRENNLLLPKLSL